MNILEIALSSFAINCVVKQEDNKNIPIVFRNSVTNYILITKLKMNKEIVMNMKQNALD